MAKHHTATVLLLLCCAALTAQARLLQQATPNARCPAGCADGACVLDSTSGGYKCTACKGSLVVNPDDGNCGCPAGRHGTTDTCQDCNKGSYCAGGRYTAPNLPAQTPCPNSLTTIGKRSTSIKACGECSLSPAPAAAAASTHASKHTSSLPFFGVSGSIVAKALVSPSCSCDCSCQLSSSTDAKPVSCPHSRRPVRLRSQPARCLLHRRCRQWRARPDHLPCQHLWPRPEEAARLRALPPWFLHQGPDRQDQLPRLL